MKEHPICFVTEEISPGTPGGIGRLLQQTVAALERVEWPAVILFGGSAEALATFRGYATRALPRTTCLSVDELLADPAASDDLPQWAFHFPAYHRSYRTALALRRVATELPLAGIELPDYGGVGYVALKWRRLWGEELSGLPMWVRLHGPDEIWRAADGRDDGRIETQQLHSMERYCLRHADGWVGPSAATVEWLGAYYGIERPSWHQPPPYDHIGEPGVHPRRLDSTLPVRLLFYGKLQRLKGADVLVEAAVALARRRPERIEVDLVGPGPGASWRCASYRDELHAAIPEDLAERFRFHGAIDPVRLPELARQCTLAVVPSRVETFCLAAHELHWIGIPLVLADLPAFRPYFRDGVNCRTFDGSAVDLERVLEDILSTAAPFDGWTAAEPTDAPAPASLYARVLAECRPPPRPSTARGGRVSVIVPFHEMQDYVDATLASIQSSTYADWEIVLVDDGSRSEAARRKVAGLRERFAGDDRVRILATPNGGLGSARNHGIACASGRYVLPLDSDDLVHPEYLRLAVTALEADPGLHAVSCFVGWFADGQAPSDVCDYVIPYDLLSPAVYLENRAGVAASVFRREVFERHHYDPSLFSFEDWDLWWQLAEAGARVETLPRLLFHYRRRRTSMVNTVGYSRHAHLVAMMLDKHEGVLRREWRAVLGTYLEEVCRLRDALAASRGGIASHDAGAAASPVRGYEYSVRLAAGLLVRLLRARMRAALGAMRGRRMVAVRIDGGRHVDSRAQEVWCAGVRQVRESRWRLDGVRGGTGDWQRRNGGARGELLVGSMPGTELHFALDGRGFGLGFLHHPWSGRVVLSVDGQSETVDLFGSGSTEGFYDHFWTGTHWVARRIG